MAPRFRPVALRPRLSAGLPKFTLQRFHYAQSREPKQARPISKSAPGDTKRASESRFCQRRPRTAVPFVDARHGSGSATGHLARLDTVPFTKRNYRENLGNCGTRRDCGAVRGIGRMVGATALRHAGNRVGVKKSSPDDHRGEGTRVAQNLKGSALARGTDRGGQPRRTRSRPSRAAPAPRCRKSAHRRRTRKPPLPTRPHLSAGCAAGDC